MAKAKKPTSGSESTSDVSKDVGVKADDKGTKAATAASSRASAKTGGAAKASTPVKASAPPTTSSIPKTAKPEPVKKPDQPAADHKPADAGKPLETAKSDSKPAEPPKSAEKKPAAKEVKPSAPAPAQTLPEKSSVFLPLVFGGVVAAGLGFVAAEMSVFSTRVDTDGITRTLNTQAERIASLESAETPPVELPDLQGVQNSIAALSDSVSALEARLAEIENRPAPTAEAGGPSPEYAEDLAALQASVEEQKTEISRLLENALSVEEATANAARAAKAQGALTMIIAALNSGAGYETALQDLTASGVQDIPAALSENSDGVAPILRLQTGFPDTARAALSAARAGGGGQTETGVAAFLKRQLSARSVAPREGTDPDAVLSRAEAAVRDGRVADALTEIETLPAPVQEAMADWLASARARAATEAAVQDLSQRLTAN
ncbi:MAG: hypothetical protein WA782_15430 [Sulfitobacter sp.]